MGGSNQNPNDGTVLGTSEVISDEFNDPVAGGRVDPNLPPTAYKIPRSKIVVGPYGQDGGDASVSNPLPAESLQQRRLAELQTLRERTHMFLALSRYYGDTISLSDARGHDISTRGQR